MSARRIFPAVGLGLGLLTTAAWFGREHAWRFEPSAEPLRPMALSPMPVASPFVRTPTGYVAPATATAPRVEVREDGRVTLGEGSSSVGMRLSAVARVDGRMTRGRLTTESDARSVDGVAVVERGTLREWYVRAGQGLEQGFDLLARPAGSGSLRVLVEVSGARTRMARGSVALVGADAEVASIIRDARAVDAAGRTLAAALEATPDGYAITVDDADARYPIRIDPFVSAPLATLVAPSIELGVGEGCGAATRISGGLAIVGCPLADVGTAQDAGEVLLYQESPTGWTYLGKLTAELPTPNARFGAAVDYDGSSIAVGAPGQAEPANGTQNVGAVYVFGSGTSATGFVQQAQITPPDPSGFLLFGASVAIEGSLVYTGAPGGSLTTLQSQGTVYIHSLGATTPTFITEFGGPMVTAEDRFGEAISVHGGLIIVGAPGHDALGSLNQGAAYGFRIDTTGGNAGVMLVGELVDPTPGAGGQFGMAVDTDGAHVLVGNPHDDNARGIGAGSVVIFAASGFGLDGVITAGDGAAGDLFGRSVAVSGDLAIVGAPGIDVIGATSRIGAAYVAVHAPGGTFTVSSKLRPTDALAGDAVGFAVDIDSAAAQAILGVPNDGVGNFAAAGTARVYGIPDVAYLGVTVTGGGRGMVGSVPDGILCPADCGEFYALDTIVTLTATAAAGSYLDTVSGDCAASPCTLGLNTDRAATFDFELTKANGVACTRNLECTSLNCIDGVCCNSECGLGVDDCQACSVEAGGTTDGTCTALTAAVATTTECRAAAGPCDAPEACSPNSLVCPADVLKTSAVVCRPAQHPVCDTAESCTGQSAACPTDVVAYNGSSCDNGIFCDGVDRCDGAGACASSSPVVCLDDGNPCTVDLCVDPIGCVSVAQPGCTVVDGGAVFADAGTPTDASTTDTSVIGPIPQPILRGQGGCGCHVSGPAPDASGAFLAFAFTALGFRRRRR